MDSGIRAAEEIVALPNWERPTAVFAANDLLAIGMLQGFVTAGLQVPDDMAIVGYDDIAFAAAAAVPLSSIRQPRLAIGYRGAELLFDEIEATSEMLPTNTSRFDLHLSLSFAAPARRAAIFPKLLAPDVRSVTRAMRRCAV